MSQRVQAVFENGILRPLEPLTLIERQRVTITLFDQDADNDCLDPTFLRYVETEADDSVSLEQVRAGLAKIGGSMTDDFRRERDE